MQVIRQLPVRQEQLALAEALGKDSDESSDAVNSAAPQSPMQALIRSKGFVWLSNSHSQIFYWALAGKHFELKQYAAWWGDTPREDWPTAKKDIDDINKEFEGDYADRRQELVFIGVKLQREAITKLLDDCLLDDNEMAAYRQHWMS